MQDGKQEASLRLEVCRRLDACDGVAVIDLRDPAGTPLPAWQPGAHIDLKLDGGIVRQYSLCGDPNDRTVWRVAVLREENGRGGSRLVHATVSAGSRIDVQGPRNHFRLEPALRYLFIAGGIGITPILPMTAAAHAAGADWKLAYGGRTRASMAFRDELVRRYGDKVDICPQDERGLLDIDGLLQGLTTETLVYCCGPEPLLQAVERRCAAFPLTSLRVERFAPKAVEQPARSGSFTIELRRSGVTLVVEPDKSILETAEDAGVFTSSSCREGTCGTCETGVLEGTPDHRDSILSPEEQATNKTMMICVSRALSAKLVLDM